MSSGWLFELQSDPALECFQCRYKSGHIHLVGLPWDEKPMCHCFSPYKMATMSVVWAPIRFISCEHCKRIVPPLKGLMPDGFRVPETPDDMLVWADWYYERGENGLAKVCEQYAEGTRKPKRQWPKRCNHTWIRSGVDGLWECIKCRMQTASTG